MFRKWPFMQTVMFCNVDIMFCSVDSVFDFVLCDRALPWCLKMSLSSCHLSTTPWFLCLSNKVSAVLLCDRAFVSLQHCKLFSVINTVSPLSTL